MPKKLVSCVKKVRKSGKSKSASYGICSKATGWKRKKGGGWINKKTGARYNRR